jgi:hypothetical protein
MASPEQTAVPLDPLAVCEEKFSEAYRFALEGDQNVRIIGETEMAPFVRQAGTIATYYVLHRPVQDQKLRAVDLSFWLSEFTVDYASNMLEELEKKTKVRDVAVLNDGTAIEVDLIDRRIGEFTPGLTFKPGVIMLQALPANFLDCFMTHSLDQDESAELFSNLQTTLPITH